MRVYLGANNILSPLGFNTSHNFESLMKNEKAVQKQKLNFSDSSFCCAKINDGQLDKVFAESGRKGNFTRLEKMCLLSLDDVIAQSHVDLSDKSSLLIISTTKGNIDVLEGTSNVTDAKRAYLSSISQVLAHEYKCLNTPLVISNACISGLLAIIIAKRFIENGTYKNIIVCGVDLVSEFTLSGFRSFNALSDEPCRPFDADRTGINLGEAAASLLLSSDQISNLIISGGATANDANHISGPSRTGDGLFQAITQTFQESGKQSADFICAHGTATEYNDAMESAAFARAGIQSLPVHSLKGYYGHTLGAAGILESVIAIESLKQNVLVRSAGFEKQGAEDLTHIITHTKKQQINSCLKTASGFGGCNAAALFEKL